MLFVCKVIQHSQGSLVNKMVLSGSICQVRSECDVVCMLLNTPLCVSPFNKIKALIIIVDKNIDMECPS